MLSFELRYLWGDPLILRINCSVKTQEDVTSKESGVFGHPCCIRSRSVVLANHRTVCLSNHCPALLEPVVHVERHHVLTINSFDQSVMQLRQLLLDSALAVQHSRNLSMSSHLSLAITDGTPDWTTHSA